MSEENDIIDLLSDSDDEVCNAIAAATPAGILHDKSNSCKGLCDDKVTLLPNTEVELPSKSQKPRSSANIHNPYAKSTAPKHNNNSEKSCSGSLRSKSKQQPINGSKIEIHNPYKTKRNDSESKMLDVSKGANKKPKQSKLPPTNASIPTELQAGLVFEEDLDHIRPNLAPTKKSGQKQASLFSKQSSLKSDDGNAQEAPSAAAYAEQQIRSRISHNLQPVLFHDPEFAAGNPATIDGTHVINKPKKSTKQSEKSAEDDFVIPPAPKCRCRPPQQCVLAYSAKGQNIDRPYYKCQHNSCKYFSWAFTSYMLHWYRFGKHNGHCLVKDGRGFRAEDLVQGMLNKVYFDICCLLVQLTFFSFAKQVKLAIVGS